MVLVLFIIEMAAVVGVYLFLEKAETKLKDYLDSSLHYRYNGNFSIASSGNGYLYSSGGDPLTLAWDAVQLEVR